MLSRRTGLLLSAVLTLSAGCATTQPVPTVPLSQEVLLGSWVLTRVGSRRVTLAMTLNFRPDGIAEGSVRCNAWKARYQVLTQRIVFPDDVIITAAGCHPRFNKSEEEIVSRASETFFNPEIMFISADRKLLYARGKEELRFERL